jgi:hypothetical protein
MYVLPQDLVDDIKRDPGQTMKKKRQAQQQGFIPVRPKTRLDHAIDKARQFFGINEHVQDEIDLYPGSALIKARVELTFSGRKIGRTFEPVRPPIVRTSSSLASV